MTIDFVIKRDNRSQSATPQTGHTIKIIFSIGCRFTRADAKTVRYDGKNLFPAFHMARRSKTDFNMVLARRVESKLGKKCCYAENLIFRYLEPSRDPANGIRTQVTIEILRSLEDGD